MATEALNVSYSTSAAVAYNGAVATNTQANRYLIANRSASSGNVDAWCTSDAAGANQVGSKISVAPGQTGILISPVRTGAVAIVLQGETAGGNADIMPVNVPNQ